MEDWKERVIKESEELEQKLVKLAQFLELPHPNLESRAFELLVIQKRAMETYAIILATRIAEF